MKEYIYSNLCNVSVIRNDPVPPTTGEDPLKDYVRKGYEFPYISTYYFNPMPNDIEDISIPLYITDYFQKEYFYNYNGEKFKLRIEIDGNVTYKNNLPAGDYTLNLGKLSKGMHWFSLQIEDSKGYLSERLYNELWVINENEYNIKQNETYTITQSDLNTHNITLGLTSTATEQQMQNNRVGLTNLFKEIKDNGYRKCVLIKGTYRVNKAIREATNSDTPISIPSNFTVDLNGSTIKMHEYTDAGLADARNSMIRFQDCTDSHLINGILEGNYAERKEKGWANGYDGEGDGCIFINGGAYNTVENVTVQQIAGYNCSHNFGSKHGNNSMVMEDKSLATWYDNTFVDGQGNDIDKRGYLTSELFNLSSAFKSVGWISASIWLRTGQIKGNHWKMYYSFYDVSRNFIETIDGCQFRRCRIPKDASYVRVTFICSKTELGTVYLHTQPSARYSAIKNCEFIDNRTCMNPNQFQHLLYDNVNFTRTGQAITPCEIDVEDGWEQSQDFYIMNCTVKEGAGAADIIAQTGLNFVVENCEKLSFNKGAQVYGACYRNNNDVVVNWGLGMYSRNTSRCYNNTNMADAVGYKWALGGASEFFGDDETKCKIKNCDIEYGRFTTGQNGFGDAVHMFVLDNCNIDIVNTYRYLNVENSTIRIKNGCNQSGYQRYKNCNFELAQSSTSIDLNFWGLDTGRIYSGCTFNGDANLKESIMWNDGTFENCNFKGVTTITLTTSRNNQFGDIRFDNCVFDKSLTININGDTKLQFNNCTFSGGVIYEGNGKNNTQINNTCKLGKQVLSKEVNSNSFNVVVKDNTVEPPPVVDRYVKSNTFTITIKDNTAEPPPAETDEPPNINNIGNMETYKNETINITYSANDDKGIIKHEFSKDGGNTYTRIYPATINNNFIYSTSFDKVETIKCKIKVTDAKNQSKESNVFDIKINDKDITNQPEVGINGKAQSSIQVYKGDIRLIGVENNPFDNQFSYSIEECLGCVAKRKNNDTFYIESISKESASVNIKVNVENKASFNKVFSVKKLIQSSGNDGNDGNDGESPIIVTIKGQNTMKYIDKTTPPIPSFIDLTAVVSQGENTLTNGVSYTWQYKNSSDTFVSLSGTNNTNTYKLTHNNSAFINDVAQLKVVAQYKTKTYYDEFTVTKLYDNKYITHQEIFDKVTNNGQYQVLYKDPQTGEIYINATFIKSGQLVADLIKGGILTLGGAIGTDDNPVNGYMRVLGADNQELAVLNGGEMTINGLSSDEATIDSLFVQDIKSPKIPPAVTENTTIYVNQTTGNDDAEFNNGAVYKTVQGAIDATPKNLNGFDVYIRLQGTSSGGVSIYSENLTYKGFYGGSLYTYLQKNYIHGYIVMRDCSARLSLVGGSNYDEIPDGASESARANIKPASLYATGNTYYVICAINCTDVYLRALDLWGSTATNSNGYPNYAIGVREGSNVFVRNVKIHSSTNGFHAQVMGRLFAVNTYGKVTNYAYRCTYGGWMNIGSGNSVSGGSSSLNISTGDGCQILQGNVTWDGSSSTGTNDNTTVNSNTTTYNATSGDSWKVKYSSWRKDNTVRQGDWSGTGMHKGCWFFGSQFSSLKGKTIKSVKLTIQRQSSGGNSGAVAFTLKMHNHSSRPSGAPSYLSGWSKNVSLSLGQSSTVTITDSAVLTAIKNGTMKGFGIEVSSTSNSYYGILSPKLKAVVTYS